MARRPTPPDFDDLVADLHRLRTKGVLHIRWLDLPALARATEAAGRTQDGKRAQAPAIERFLRVAISELDTTQWTYAASILYGLAPELRRESPGKLRRDAAEAWGVSESRWRQHYEKITINQIAEIMLIHCDEHQMRLAALEMERRTPAASRLAVAWVERFEAYYRIWTPVYGLAADLTAYRTTLLEPDRPYDRPPTEEEPDGYSQEAQAAGYATYALFHYAEHLTMIEDLQQRHGGLWLLSDKTAETEASDAVARVRLASPCNEEYDSYLRILYDQCEGEIQPFRQMVHSDRIASDIEDEWQRFVNTCDCTWDDDADRGYFAANTTHRGIDEACQVHSIIRAANDYCLLIDNDWDRIADWYHIGTPRQQGLSAEEQYRTLRQQTKKKGVRQWPPW